MIAPFLLGGAGYAIGGLAGVTGYAVGTIVTASIGAGATIAKEVADEISRNHWEPKTV
jgi:hypothetical protein